MRVIVRAFNNEGYHKDIVVMSNKQIHRSDVRIKEALQSLHTGLLGVGARIDPAEFPEMVSFEVVIKEETR